MNTVAILSPGDMGHAVGQLLLEHELRVVTCLAGRSARTRALSEKAGIVDLPSLEDMVSQSDVILSITVSEAVPRCLPVGGRRHARHRREASVWRVQRRGAPAGPPHGTHHYRRRWPVCGRVHLRRPRPGTGPARVSTHRVPMHPSLRACGSLALMSGKIGPEIGQASGIKMCYAAMTKGSSALYTQLLVAAEAMGLLEPLKAEFRSGQAQVMERMERSLSGVPARSRRWVSEMEEIAATFQHLGCATGHIGYRQTGDIGNTKVRCMQGMASIAVQEPDLEGTEVDRPVSIVFGLQSHRLPAQRLAEINPLSLPLDLSIGPDLSHRHPGLVLWGVHPSGILTCRRSVAASWRLLSQRFMGPHPRCSWIESFERPAAASARWSGEGWRSPPSASGATAPAARSVPDALAQCAPGGSPA